MKNIVIIGASGHAKVIIDIIEKENIYKIKGLLDDRAEEMEDTFCNYNLIGKTSDLPGIMEKENIYSGIIAIGDNWIRYKVLKKIKEIAPDFSFINAIHPSSEIAGNVKIGKGNAIMAGTVINSDSRIGDFCIINTGASIDHDNCIEDFASIAPGVTTGGNVSIGSFSAVSLGASLIHGISIGEQTVIGAGATVLKNIPSLVIAYGTPAKVIRDRKAGDKYL